MMTAATTEFFSSRKLGPLFLFCLFTVTALPGILPAAELARLTADTWDEYAPRGKEVDCIYGDFVLRNDRIIAVVANPVPNRHANVTVRQVGGVLIDLTERWEPNDQLSAFYPGARRYRFRLKSSSLERLASAPSRSNVIRAPSVELVCISLTAKHQPETPEVEVTYSLRDGEPYLRITTIYRNRSEQPITLPLVDEMRADRTFEKTPDGDSTLFWVYDLWFGQAYGVLPDNHQMRNRGIGNRGAATLRYLQEGEENIVLEPGKPYVLSRLLFPKKNLLEVKSQARRIQGKSLLPFSLFATDTAGQPVSDVDVTLDLNGESYGNARTLENGRLQVPLPPGMYHARLSAPGRGSANLRFDVNEGQPEISVKFPVASRVVARISDVDGHPIACKVQFVGIEGTESPHFGPDSGEHAVHNLYYSHNGRFTRIVPPGSYQVIISHGPEYDAVFTRLDVPPEQDVPLRATLRRVVETPGWISADFHSHSSPSGDNTTSQLGRVLNLVAEHIEFAPCTEHNRISTYIPHLKRLGIEGVMATASGIELTGGAKLNVYAEEGLVGYVDGAVNDQNAFPLIRKPHIQDGGAPRRHHDPELQIQRLALWDRGSEKLVQENHPDIGQVFFDKDGDEQPDGGFRDMSRFMDVIEVHPIHRILTMEPTYRDGNLLVNHRIFNWLQLLNQGYRIPGVVNTDAHYAFHGSGWLRNYLPSPTDDPAKIRTLDIVHAAERGNVVMTNGPFLEVYTPSGDRGVDARITAGDKVKAPAGKLPLHVRVQCPNWFDIDRVQILINGRADPRFNFTRAETPTYFSSGVVKFDQKIPLHLESDAHLIVVAIGEHSKLGPVMGPERGEIPPLAVSNPIYVDVDGGGFQPNGDTLGAPLPVKLNRRVVNP